MFLGSVQFFFIEFIKITQLRLSLLMKVACSKKKQQFNQKPMFNKNYNLSASCCAASNKRNSTLEI